MTIQFINLNKYVKVKGMLRDAARYLVMSLIMGVAVVAVTELLNLKASFITTVIQMIIGIVVFGFMLVFTKDELILEVRSIIKDRKN